jgi:diguanylate cyclase (GGDEF)-like protein
MNRRADVDETSREPIRVLVADDEAALRDAYRQILVTAGSSAGDTMLAELRARLVPRPGGAAAKPVAAKIAPSKTRFDATFCNGAEAAVAAVRDALAAGRPIAVAFIDMRMPPGPDGLWAAGRIRELDPAIEIVICTAYAEVDSAEIAALVPPEEKLSYLQKPFHPGEIRQMALSLGSKWRAEHRIINLAYFDSLTGLPNREQLRTRMIAAIAAADQRHQSMAVLYLDLDKFKRVNDTLGHAAGDQLLCLVAATMRRSVRTGDPVSAEVPADGRAGHIARLGGDEFIVILPDPPSVEDAGRVAERLIADLKKPMQIGAHSVVITPSIGIAVYPRDGADADTLLRHADLAMYFAKRAAPGTYEFFDASMQDAARQRFAIEEKLHGALERGEFSLQYQPQFDVVSGGIAGMEALLRWNSPELGAVPPMAFIPVAEESGLILPIGEWVLRNACLQANAWREEGLPPLRMAVNVSGQQFMLREFPETVAAIIAETGMDPRLLELEITESVVMRDEAASERAFAQLKRLGVGLAIDDFGTGYSSFGRLRKFSVNRLKIDRSFLTSLVECNDDQAIAKALIAMSHSLRISVTAEGVENFPQLAFLQEQACNEAQGYLLSHPLMPADALALLRRAATVTDTGRTARLRAIVS